MDFLNDPVLWVLSGVAILIVIGPWFFKTVTGLFKRSDDKCLEKIEWLMEIRSGISDEDAKKAIDGIMLILIGEHDKHE